MSYSVVYCSEGFSLPLGALDRLGYLIVILPGPSMLLLPFYLYSNVQIV